MTKKEELILALETEREVFNRKGYAIDDHDYAIKYLKDGTKPDMPDSVIADFYDMLDAVINDFDGMYEDYVTNSAK